MFIKNRGNTTSMLAYYVRIKQKRHNLQLITTFFKKSSLRLVKTKLAIFEKDFSEDLFQFLAKKLKAHPDD